MQIMIHACPDRMWYVNEFLIPELERQGAKNIIVWLDAVKAGNLVACMEAFAACEGDGGAWHLQDDVLLCRDFMQRISELRTDKVLCGFVNETGGPNCNLRGEVYAADMWYSFPCTYIPNKLARECAEWYFTDAWKFDALPEAYTLASCGRGDDYFFREFMEIHHGGETVINLTPCLVEHIDWMLGGSLVSPYRGYLTRAVYWDDEDLVRALSARIRARMR